MLPRFFDGSALTKQKLHNVDQTNLALKASATKKLLWSHGQINNHILL